MKLISGEGKSLECVEIKGESIGVLSEERMRILRMLSSEPLYPAEIARRMGMQVQAVYYHMKLLEKASLARFVEYEERGGAMAKKFSAASDSFAIVLNEKGWKAFRHSAKAAPRILAPFIKNGSFEGRIVMGSPDPHGKYRARGNELCMVEFAMLLGQHASFSFPLYLLDTQLRERDLRQNLVLAGGPKVNTLVSRINRELPIRFDEGSFEVHSTLSGKKYRENIGLIELVRSPFDKKSSVLLVGGLNQNGTRAAVLCLIKKMKEIEEGNEYSPRDMAKVVEGFDDDGDGVVDSVEILE